MNDSRPNILFIMSDDHAAHAMSCYGSRINTTPQIDRIAEGGMRFNNCFCTNSLCTPSRASILTGTYSHVNGTTTIPIGLDNRLQTFPKLLRASGYQTAVFGKWHLGDGARHDPTGFDDWAILPGQGYYHNPTFRFPGPDGPQRRTVPGYVTDLITDMSLDWLRRRDRDRPFCLLCHHKAPHAPWYSDEKHAGMYLNETIPEPETLQDDYANRALAAERAVMRVGVHMDRKHVHCEMPDNMPEPDLRRWAYQRYIKNYLRVVASIDDNVGRLLDYLRDEGREENTLVIYTSDQGFFLGDHGWYDKRFMYEESIRMPMVLRYPAEVAPGSTCDDIVLNVDFASLFCDLAGLDVPPDMQGRSFRPLWQAPPPEDWRQSMYYRYWENAGGHNVGAHYGVRTRRYKLVHYYYNGCGQEGADGDAFPWGPQMPSVKGLDPEWELFDLEDDPHELHNVYGDSAYAPVVAELTAELARLQAELGDTPCETGTIEEQKVER